MGGKHALDSAMTPSRCRCLKSGFGAQVKSQAPSAPAWGFGTSLRDAVFRQHISAEHAKAMCVSNSQGPVYRLYSAIGRQGSSPNLSSPEFSFGSSSRSIKYGRSGMPGPGAYKNGSSIGRQNESKRCSSARAVFGTTTRDAQNKVHLDDELAKTFYGVGTPAPNVYNLKGTMGRQVLSARRSLPSWSVGTEQRFRYDFIQRARQLPGSGQYRHQTACGRQELSINRTYPKFSFGQSTRDKLQKVFISPEHEKQSHGACSPGPITARPSSSLGRQYNSKKKSNPGWGFGTSKRIRPYHADIPGPGTYCA